MIPSGRARLEQDIIDLSVLPDTGLKGIAAVAGVTQRGPVGDSILVGSWTEYRKHFGDLIEESDFPLICKRALERGAKLRIARVAHLDDFQDITTLQGAKATAGVDSGKLVFEASSVGTWGDGLHLNIKHSGSFGTTVNAVDIHVTLDKFPELSYVVKGIKNNAEPEKADFERFNRESPLVKINIDDYDWGSIGTVRMSGFYDFDNGEDALDGLKDSDYTGSEMSNTGIHAFDNYNDFVRVAVPELAKNGTDQTIVAYCEGRKDCRALLRTPIMIDGNAAMNYRACELLYDGTAIDSAWADMCYGTITVIDPRTGGTKDISVIGDVIGIMSYRDSKYNAWLSAAGSKRGRLKNLIGVQYNLGTAARTTEFDIVANAGVNPVVDDRDFGPVLWGNRTLSRSNTLLRYSNVMDLIVDLFRSLSPKIRSEIYDPNDITTWKNIYRKVRPELENYKNKRGIYDYLYQGDQNIDRIEDAKVNSSQNIDAGQYLFNLFIKPTPAMEYIGMRVVVTNSGVSFAELITQPVQ